MSIGVLKRIKKEFFIESVIFWTGIGSAALFWGNNLLLSLIFLALCAVRLKLYHSGSDLFFFFSGMIFGPLSETILVQFGVWSYANPTFLGVPVWLPLAWGLATLMVKRFAEIFIRFES